MADQEHVARWMAWADGDYGLPQADEFIANCLADYAAPVEPENVVEYAIEVDGRPVGAMGVPRSSVAQQEYEIGYWLSAPLTGRGIVTRCAQALTDYLFAERHAHRVQIAAFGGNTASRAVAERLGFTLEGVFREARLHRARWHDLAWYAITEDEWRRLRVSAGGRD